MSAYYNEHDPFAAAWLRELIADNLIAPGVVDERSIEDVTPDELRPFQQCHFFAGIGVWSLAARLAGIPDHAPLWSGSCPCQPFSAAGQGGGFDDERHLWPAFHYLLEQCEPPLAVGEQVAGADGDAWLDLVSADLDATGYAFGAAETVAAGFGAPHKRSRNYWVAHADARLGKQFKGIGAGPGNAVGGGALGQSARRGDVVELADCIGARLERLGGNGNDRRQPGRDGTVAVGSAPARGAAYGLGDAVDESGRAVGQVSGGTGTEFARGGDAGGLDNATYARHEPEGGGQSEQSERWRGLPSVGRKIDGYGRPGPVNGFWGAADWLRCRDEKWRAVEPETFPLADVGAFRNRVGLLRGAGNAITLGQAVGWFQAVRHAVGDWW